MELIDDIIIDNLMLPEPSQRDLHEFGIIVNGKCVDSSYFASYQDAITKAALQIDYPYDEIIDLTKKWYVDVATKYIQRIKKIHPSFKITSLKLDMTRLYYSRTAKDWYTYIPFQYKGTKWAYRENAKEDWIEKMK